MARTIDALLTDFNTKLEGRLSYSEMVFKRLAVLQPLDGVTFPMERIEQREGRKISPFDEQGLTFYHRIESEDIETIIGKGNSSYNRILYNMIIVGIGYRPNITTATTWNNEDIAQNVMNAIGQGMILDFKERVVVQGRPTTDKLTVLNEEYVGNPIMQEKVLDLIAFKIPYTLEVKQIYCDDATSPVTSLTVNPQEQAGSDGQPITQIDITANAPSLLEVSNLPSGLAFEVLSNTTAKITGNAPSSTEIITIIATGAAGGRIGSYASIEVGGATPVTDLTYSNDDQTIWAQSDTGSLTTMEPTTTPSNATGTYSSGDIPAGMALDTNTGFITVSDITLMPLGESTFTVTFTASGSFSGTPTYLVTVTRRELWEYTDLGASLLQWWDYGDFDGITFGAEGQANLIPSQNGGASLTPSAVNYEAFKSNINGNNALSTANNAYQATFADLVQEWWFFASSDSLVNSDTLAFISSNATNRLLYEPTSRRFRIDIGGSSTFIGVFSNSERQDLYERTGEISIGSVFEFRVNGASSHFKIDDGQAFDSGTVSFGTADFPSSGGVAIFGGTAPNQVTTATGGQIRDVVLISGALTSDEVDQVQGAMAHRAGTQSLLPPAHPYFTLPPFKPLP